MYRIRKVRTCKTRDYDSQNYRNEIQEKFT